MIRKQKIYVTSSGRRFDTLDEARSYELLWMAVESLMIQLPLRPEYGKHPMFNNDHLKLGEHRGANYLQHDPEVYWRVRNGLLDLAQEHIDYLRDDKKFQEIKHSDQWDICFVARFIEGRDPFSSAWERFMNIDPITCREYEQPFFAIHNWKDSYKEKYGKSEK